jgi:hypothetical protein
VSREPPRTGSPVVDSVVSVIATYLSWTLRAAAVSGSLAAAHAEAAIDSAVAAYLIKWRHLAAVDDWLAELERAHGPVPAETLEWAAQFVERWDAGRAQPSKRRRAG